MTEPRSAPVPERDDADICACEDGYLCAFHDDSLCQCQGCGAWRGIAALGKPHNCHRAEDGTYEEGGTFQ